MSKLSIVVPSFNESENVKPLVDQLDEALVGIDHEIIFVDDSKDNTPDVIREIIEKKPHVRLEHRVGETGLATAVLKGFTLAEGDYVACMDADLQHPPKILKYMYYALEEGYDFCIPSRFIPGGSDGGLNLYRKFVSGVARYIGKICLPCLRRVTDPTSGLFMFRRECLEGADLQPIGWKIMVEVLAMCKYGSIIEIPYTFQDREAGESKLSGKVTMEYLKQVFNLMKRASVKKPVPVSKWSVEKMQECDNK
ncbi:MAG: polyprenol monophosphomannose synthase [Lachnospiraceae bacterium]|nr:polyprenol monophosphomannose synthase [Lachnospiraceae bacterium]